MNPQPKYSQAELDKHLLDAANALRGPIDPADFKAYIFPLLFLKRISDAWKWEYAQLMEDFDDEEVALDPKSHRFVVPESCTWDDVLKLNENVGAGLQNILNRLEEANPNSLAGVFGNARWADKNTLPEARLTAVIDVFSRLTLDPENVPHDLLGNAYEYLLKNFADESGKKAGEFFTPRAVVHMLVQLLDPQEGESIYDPTCGSGGMLVDAVNSVRASGGEARSLQLYGQEVQATTAAIARMNLYLHDIETFEIKTGDTLREPKNLTSKGALKQFDAVIANPPFSLKGWGEGSWAHDPFGRSKFGVPPKGYGDLAFVEHMVSSMSPTSGRVAVVMPHGVLFRSGAEQRIRKNLIEAGLLEAVIGLPPNLFYNTPIPACVLIFRAEPRGALEGGIAFIDASERFIKGKNQNELRQEDSEAVVTAFRSLKDPDGIGGVQLRLVNLADIQANDFDLNIGRYIEGASPEEVDLPAALARYRETRESLRAAEESLDAALAETGLDVG